MRLELLAMAALNTGVSPCDTPGNYQPITRWKLHNISDDSNMYITTGFTQKGDTFTAICDIYSNEEHHYFISRE